MKLQDLEVSVISMGVWIRPEKLRLRIVGDHVIQLVASYRCCAEQCRLGRYAPEGKWLLNLPAWYL